MSLAEDIAALTAEIATLTARRADLLLRLHKEQHAAKVQRLVPRVRKMPPEIKAALRQDMPPVDVYMSLAKRHLIVPNQAGWSKAGRAIREALALIDAEQHTPAAGRTEVDHAP